MGVITFNGITSTSVGVQVAHPPKFVYPEKDSEAVHVPGRNGDIIIDKDSYKNVPREYELTVYDQAHPEWTYSERMVKVSNWLHSAKGYAKLSDTYDVGYFRKARYVEEAQEFENFINEGGVGTITFDCRPERFLDSGDVVISSSTATSASDGLRANNPTQYISKPKIRIVGSTGDGESYGELTVTLRLWRADTNSSSNIFKINGARVQGGTPEVIIDSELQTIWCNSPEPFTYQFYDGFPLLYATNNRLYFSSGNALLEVTPRWYII